MDEILIKTVVSSIFTVFKIYLCCCETDVNRLKFNICQASAESHDTWTLPLYSFIIVFIINIDAYYSAVYLIIIHLSVY